MRLSEATASSLTKEEVAGETLLKPLTQKKEQLAEDHLEETGRRPAPQLCTPQRLHVLYNHSIQSQQSMQQVRNPAQRPKERDNKSRQGLLPSWLVTEAGWAEQAHAGCRLQMKGKTVTAWHEGAQPESAWIPPPQNHARPRSLTAPESQAARASVSTTPSRSPERASGHLRSASSPISGRIH